MPTYVEILKFEEEAPYSLLLDVNRMMPILPRDCRYSIGQELRQTLMEIIVLIYRASRVKKKIYIISDMREKLLEAQVFIRLMNDMKYISERKYVQLIEQTTSMSKQMSAWEKSEMQKRSDGHNEQND